MSVSGHSVGAVGFDPSADVFYFEQPQRFFDPGRGQLPIHISGPEMVEPPTGDWLWSGPEIVSLGGLEHSPLPMPLEPTAPEVAPFQSLSPDRGEFGFKDVQQSSVQATYAPVPESFGMSVHATEDFNRSGGARSDLMPRLGMHDDPDRTVSEVNVNAGGELSVDWRSDLAHAERASFGGLGWDLF